ncbi:hypothetical protein VAEKB19_1980019 [Vibrio aestuarianus]|nr:hypothetical protein VAEKB19_1980019 [Vibrio aestuarianus]
MSNKSQNNWCNALLLNDLGFFKDSVAETINYPFLYFCLVPTIDVKENHIQVGLQYGVNIH